MSLDPLPPRRSRLAFVVDVALLVALFYLLAGTPPPDANEAHYLAKAKHYWDRSWCAGDLFLESADAHLMFYWTVGWLTRFCSLSTVAWMGRLAGWTLVACAWRAFSFALIPRPYYAVLSGAACQLFITHCNAGGEWVIGGVEAKVFAFAFLFWGLADLVQLRWRSVWIWFGAAAAFHVLVGGWAVIIGLGVWLSQGRARPKLASQLGALALGFLLSLPGLLPAVALTAQVDPGLVRQASKIYVFERLAHHLLPSTFETSNVIKHLALGVTWLILCLEPATVRGQTLWRRFVAGAVLLALLGVVWENVTAGRPELTAALLRYYLFRLSDVLLPAGVALESCILLAAWRASDARSGRLAFGAAALLVSLALAPTAWSVVNEDWPGADYQSSVEDLVAWRNMCHWIEHHTPPDAKFLSLRDHYTFKWYAGRAEVANWKDVPQDAKALVEWLRVQEDIWAIAQPAPGERWCSSITERSDADLRTLAQRYGFRYLIVERPYAVRKLPFRRIYPNREASNPVYQIFEIPPAPSNPTSNTALPARPA